jgi:penicillin amidase
VRFIVGAVAIVLVVIIGAAVLVTGAVSVTSARAFPPTTGSLQLAGLSAPVTVSRDVNGLVRIAADTPADLFLAQGYVHASERLWQMDIWRHIASGRLAEIFGSSQLDTDRFIRTLGWRQAAERDVAAASPDALAALTAYAAGVNAYVASHRDALGPAFAIAGGLSGAGLGAYVPEDWTPADSAAWGKVQAWSLGGDYDAEIFRVLAAKQGVDPAIFPTLFPPYPSGAPVVVPTGAPGSGGAGASASTGVPGAAATRPAATRPAATPALAGTSTRAGSAAQVAGLRRLAEIGDGIGALAGITGSRQLAGGTGIGSNDWVVGPSKSATGGALLANDPHLAQSAPSIWFVNQLTCRTVDAACPYDVGGVSFPGVPGVIIGHDARIAWGATNVNPDVQDLFIETADPADPSKYLTPTGSVPFVTRTETIRVAGGDPVTMTVRQTADGPILNDVVDSLENDPELYALRWTATDRPDTSFASFLALDRAQGWDDFRAALSTYGAPSQNFVYADVDGHIGYQMPGAVPIRRDGVPDRKSVV